MITVEFTFRIGERVRCRRTGHEGAVSGLMVARTQINYVQIDDGTVNGGSHYNWYREEELQRVEQ